jgi:hypothetical protein
LAGRYIKREEGRKERKRGGGGKNEMKEKRRCVGFI